MHAWVHPTCPDHQAGSGHVAISIAVSPDQLKGLPDSYVASHKPGADGKITITTDYDTAKQIFVSGDPQAGMQAMMSGKLKIQGDMSKLMSMAQQGGAPAGGPALAEAIQGITE